MNKRFSMLILLLLLSIGSTTPTTAFLTQIKEVDVTARAYRVVDEDTFDAFPV